jgi:hypothetical protein
VSESGVTNPWEPWQRLIDAIGPDYRRLLLKARDRAKAEIDVLDEDGLGSIAAEGRAIASSLDEEGARLTASLHDDRDRHSKLAGKLQREAEEIRRRARRTIAPRRRLGEPREAAGRAREAEEHHRLGAQAHQRIRELGQSGRHL